MTDEIEVVADTTEEPVVDPIEEARATDLASEQATAGVEASPEAIKETAPEAKEEPNQVQLLQDQLITSKSDLNRLQGQMRQALPLLKQMRDKQQGASTKKIDPEEFLKAFVKDPEGVIRYMFGGLSKTELAPLRGELSASRRDSAIQSFMRDHPELGVEGEEKIGAILSANPHLTNLGPDAPVARVKLALKDALNTLIAQDPAGYTASLEALKSGGDTSIQDAKAAASGLGNKRGSATTTPSEQDEFDAVLNLSNSVNDRYAAGVER